MMHQCDQAQAVGLAAREIIEDAEGEPINQHNCFVRKRREQTPRLFERRSAGARILTWQTEVLKRIAERLELRQDPSRIDVAPGRPVDIARNGEEGWLHKSDSYQPRATWLSCSVTRILRMRAPPSPRAPRPITAASPSKTCLARNSVVVIRPLKVGSSSRFR